MKLSLFLLAILSLPCYAQIKPLTPKPGTVIREPIFFPTDWRWTKAAWTGSDKPFLAIRSSVDAQVAKRVPLATLAKKYEQQLQTHPENAKALYGWAYSVVVAPKPNAPISDNAVNRIIQEMEKVSSPHAAEFDRVRYLSLLYGGTWLQLKPLGDKLLKRYPNDFLTRFYQASLLLAMGPKSERKRALKMAQALLKEQPKRSSVYGLMGAVYKEQFYEDLGDHITRKITKGSSVLKRDAGQKAIAYYQRAWQMSANNPARRASCEYWIKTLRKRMAG